MKTLHLLRHAKSSWDDASLDDHDRPLNKRGRRAAEAAAAYLAGAIHPPELVLGSTARRVRQTLEPILAALKPTRVLLDHGLYLARSSALLEHLRGTDESVDSVLLIGHNPGLHELALALCEPSALASLPPITDKFPTGALASFQFSGRWCRLSPGIAKLLTYHPPRASGAAT